MWVNDLQFFWRLEIFSSAIFTKPSVGSLITTNTLTHSLWISDYTVCVVNSLLHIVWIMV
jgi:hypothetical protein